MHIKLPLALLLLLCTFAVSAQTADQVEVLLQTSAVTCEQAAWLVLEAAGADGANALTADEAFRFAAEKKWLPKKATPTDNINLMQTSLLIMQAFNRKGGAWYTLFKTPHYAYRELVYQDIIQGRADPRRTVTGEQLLFLVNRLLYISADNPWDWSENQQ